MTTTATTALPAQHNAATRRSRARMAERLLDDATLTPAELRQRLERHAMCDNPGVHIEHIIETWNLWNEINPQTLEEQDQKLRLDFEVYKSICFLVTPASAR